MKIRLAIKRTPEGETGLRNIRERIGPFLLGEPAFVHGWWVQNASGEAVSITAWDDDDIAAHEAALRQIPPLPGIDTSLISQPDERHILDVIRAVGMSVGNGHVARIAWFAPSENAADRHCVDEDLLPALEKVDGFLSFVLAHITESGEIVSLTLWQSEAALRAGEEAVKQRGETAGLELPRPSRVDVFQVLHEVDAKRSAAFTRSTAPQR